MSQRLEMLRLSFESVTRFHEAMYLGSSRPCERTCEPGDSTPVGNVDGDKFKGSPMPNDV